MPRSDADRYEVIAPLGKGGMASVMLARLTSVSGFERLVAIKELHPHLASEKKFVTMLLDEARVSAQIRHPNVVGTLDVYEHGETLRLIMEYVEGASLNDLVRLAAARGAVVPTDIALTIAGDSLRGLHAAHETRAVDGTPLHVVHRDVSPHNILVGTDGVSRITDFGIAKAVGRLTVTATNEVVGKLSYMAPEQFGDQPVSRQVDVRAIAVVLWELLANRKIYIAAHETDLLRKVIENKPDLLRRHNRTVPLALETVIMKALSSDLAVRPLDALEFAASLAKFPHAARDDVKAWVSDLLAELLEKRSVVINSMRSAEDTQADEAPVALKPHESNSQSASLTAGPVVQVTGAAAKRAQGRTWMWALGAIAAALTVTLASVALQDRTNVATLSQPDRTPVSKAVTSLRVEPAQNPPSAPDMQVLATTAPVPPTTSSVRHGTPAGAKHAHSHETVPLKASASALPVDPKRHM
jgi:eukaryotic-like serine/threonine-protein kinase